MTPTAYIVVPTSLMPKESGWYYVMNPNREILPRMIEYKAGAWHNHNKVWAAFWLKPIDLSKMLETCWEKSAVTLFASLDSAKHDKYKTDFFNPILNSEK